MGRLDNEVCVWICLAAVEYDTKAMKGPMISTTPAIWSLSRT